MRLPDLLPPPCRAKPLAPAKIVPDSYMLAYLQTVDGQHALGNREALSRPAQNHHR